MGRSSIGLAALAGALGGATALLILLAGSSITGQPGFLELVHNGATVFVPLELFEAGIGAFGGFAKGFLFVGIAVALVAAGAGIAIVLVRVDPASSRPSWSETLWIGLLALAIAELVVLPIFGAGFFGSAYVGDVPALQVPLILACFAYGAVTVGVLRDIADEAAIAQDERVDPSATPMPRRRFIGGAAAVVGLASVGIASVGVVARVVSAGRANDVATSPPQAPGGYGPTPAITPVDDFYTISKDLFPTRVDGASWRLAVGGLVDSPREYSLEELRSFPMVEGHRTLQCISNEVATYGRLIGNQRWAGLRAVDVLNAAGVAPSATHVLWRSADGYTESLPIEVARDPRTWLAYEMGPPGTALADEHGYPLRVLIAGRYGMKQPKWLTGIELADHDEPGYWEQRGWDQTAAVRTYSRIDQPRTLDSVTAGVAIGVFGIASAGDRGIARVEVSADDGATWTDAEVEATATGIEDLTWRRWRASVILASAGRHVLVVRATDGTGMVQDGTPRPTLPSGATGWHRVRVDAIAGTAEPAPRG
jgi:DMSO/TMAO reductase YedYZ molybdopterin-dependent catalytic subunit